MSATYGSLGEVVRAAEEVSEGSIEGSVITIIREELDDSERARVLDLYDDGLISEHVARQLLGDDAFEDAREKARGTEMLLSGDPSRFLTNG